MLAATETAALYQVALWDAMIVEAAARGGCDRLFSEDFQHGAEIRGVLVENPFTA